jgi:hypothetical protein
MQPNNAILFIINNDYENIVHLYLFTIIYVPIPNAKEHLYYQCLYTCHILNIIVTLSLILEHNRWYCFFLQCYKELLFRSVNMYLMFLSKKGNCYLELLVYITIYGPFSGAKDVFQWLWGMWRGWKTICKWGQVKCIKSSLCMCMDKRDARMRGMNRIYVA